MNRQSQIVGKKSKSLWGLKINLIVDSNIIFSAILNIDSRIGQILVARHNTFNFYAPKYVRDEILEHQGKLKKIANLNDSGFRELFEIITKNITILDHSIVDRVHYESALKLCSKIDIDDVPFVAFSFYLECKLWTGDKKLIKGLRKRGFNEVITTNEIFEVVLEHPNS